MRLVCMFALTLFVVYAQCQTCVIGYRTKDVVYFGADSRFIQTDVGKDDTTSFSGCKIQKLQKYYVSFTHGFPNEIFDYASEAERATNNLSEFIARFKARFSQFLLKELDSTRKANSEYYFKAFPYDYHICSAIFFGFENDTSFLKCLYFFNGETKNNNVLLLIKPVSINIKAPWGNGQIDEIYEKLVDKQAWSKGSKKRKIFSLIKEQCDNHPATVAEPISIIKVTKKGHSWLRNQCKG